MIDILKKDSSWDYMAWERILHMATDTEGCRVEAEGCVHVMYIFPPGLTPDKCMSGCLAWFMHRFMICTF